MGNEANVLNFSASGGASSGLPSAAGEGGALGLAQRASAPSRVSVFYQVLLHRDARSEITQKSAVRPVCSYRFLNRIP